MACLVEETGKVKSLNGGEVGVSALESRLKRLSQASVGLDMLLLRMQVKLRGS